MIDGLNLNSQLVFNLESFVLNKKITHEFRLSFNDLILGFNVGVIDLNDVLTIGFLFSMSLTELSSNLFDLFCNFECLIHDIDQTGSFSRDYQTKFNVIFFLLILIFDQVGKCSFLVVSDDNSKEEKNTQKDI